MLLPGAIFELKIHQGYNAPQTSKLVFRGPFVTGEGTVGKGRGGGKEEKVSGEGRVSPLLLFTI